MKITINQAIENHITFCRVAFTKSTFSGLLLKIKEELAEVKQAIVLHNEKPTHESLNNVKKELVDSLAVLLFAFDKINVTMDEVAAIMDGKTEINRTREWKYNGDGSYSHIKK